MLKNLIFLAIKVFSREIHYQYVRVAHSVLSGSHCVTIALIHTNKKLRRIVRNSIVALKLYREIKIFYKLPIHQYVVIFVYSY